VGQVAQHGKQRLLHVELYDGSHMNHLQVVVFKEIAGFEELVKCNLGSSFQFNGKLIKSPAKGQLFELQLSQPDKHGLTVLGRCEA